MASLGEAPSHPSEVRESPEERASREAVEELARVVTPVNSPSPPQTRRGQVRTLAQRQEADGAEVRERVAPPEPDVPVVRAAERDSPPAPSSGRLEWDSPEVNAPGVLQVAMLTYPHLRPEGAGPPAPRASRHRNKRRYNRRRHLEMGDLVSCVDSPPRRRSPTPPGPPTQGSTVATAPTGPPPSYEEAVRKMQEFCRGRLARFPVKERGVMFGGLPPVPIDPAIDPPPTACFNCWQKGHSRLRCPRPVQREFCFNCGRRGVVLTTCPRCAEVHRRYVETTYPSERGRSAQAPRVARDGAAAARSCSQPPRRVVTATIVRAPTPREEPVDTATPGTSATAGLSGEVAPEPAPRLRRPRWDTPPETAAPPTRTGPVAEVARVATPGPATVPAPAVPAPSVEQMGELVTRLTRDLAELQRQLAQARAQAQTQNPGT